MTGELEADVVVVGAGAAGLWATARLARGGADVLLLEKTPRTGTKVLASGGTRCNLTTTLGARAAAELFGRQGARFLGPAFRALDPPALREHFARLGVPTVEAPLEKVFPASGRARDVRDALLRDAEEAGARIRCDAPVAATLPLGERGADGWSVELARGERVRARSLVLSPGGASYPRTGTTGDGYRWLAALDLPVVEPVPALVPLSSPAAWVRELAGVSLQDVEARLEDGERRVLGRRARPVLFTHHGVSGPGAMDLSEPAARAQREAERAGAACVPLVLRLDLCPGRSREELRERLIEAAGRPGGPLLSRAIDLALPRRVLQAALLEAGFADEPRAGAIDRAGRHRLVEALKGLAVPVDGTLGFDAAEVTAGGLALTHVDPGTMRVRGWRNLWACGEILDLAGPIGGLNFQAAFATAEVAARDALRAGRGSLSS